jgi:two-component system response regulator (stage 0 sporulation protein F)
MKPVPVHDHGKGEFCTIMVVDDDESMRALLVDALQEDGCRVVVSSDGKGALDALQTVTPNLIVTDLKIPDGGYPYLRLLKQSVPQIPIIVMTAYGDGQSKAKTLECGVQGYLEKPLRLKDLKTWICQMCVFQPCRNLPLL